MSNDNTKDAETWLYDPRGGVDMMTARQAAAAKALDVAAIASQFENRTFERQPWAYEEGDRQTIVVLAEFPELGPRGKRAHLTILYLEAWRNFARWGPIDRRIPGSALATVNRLVKESCPA